MTNHLLAEKAKQLAVFVVNQCKTMQENKTPSALVNQLLRCGTSVGANLAEAHYAQGKMDFISKLEIALKECNETLYWFSLLRDTGYFAEAEYRHGTELAGAIQKMLISSVRTTKENLHENR